MMVEMPRPRPPHLHQQVTRHGRVVWYVRVGKGKRVRVADFGTEEFETQYQAAVSGGAAVARRGASAGSLSWLIEQYRGTAAWAALSTATRRQRDNIFKHVIAASGNEPASKINQASIVAAKEARGKTPAQARNFLDAMRGLFQWALEAKHVKADPTQGVKNPARKKGDGFIPWTEKDVEAYHLRWPLGTRQRVWVDVLLYTGLRRGDAVRLGRQHVRDGVAALRTEKSQGDVEVTLPILPILSATLDAGPTGDLTFICGAAGKPLTKESFGNDFKAACVAAGVPGSAHGVRKIAATTAANAGATVAQLEAIFGWTGGAMASLYTRKADRRRLAKEAMSKLANDERTSIPSPDLPVRDRELKAK